MVRLTCKKFNDQYPIGTVVRYWPIRRANGMFEGVPTIAPTRTPAWDVCGEPVVKIEGKAGGVSLAHIEIAAEGR